MRYLRVLVFCSLVLSCLSERAFSENWSQWRGPQQNGTSAQTGLSETIDPNHLLWTTPLPGPGSSTPVVCNAYVFVTAADKSAKTVVAAALNADTGKLLWTEDLGENRTAAGMYDMTAPSPVTDGTTVWFLTGSGDLAAFTTDGKPVWRRDLAEEYGDFAVGFGYSSSPLLYDGVLYIPVMRNEKPGAYELNKDRTEPLDSYLLAVDPQTGKNLWKHIRDTDATEGSREAYVTPYPYEWNGRKEILIAAGECITGHDPATGAELWRWWFTPANRLSNTEHNVPTPVAQDGLIFVVRPEQRPLFAIRPGEKGLQDDSILAWTYEENKCWIASPCLYRNRLYVLQEQQKTLVCLEPKTGRIVWQHDLPVKGVFQASPTAADGKIYCISTNGQVVVLAAGDEYRVISTANLNEKFCRSSIVPAGSKLYIRTGSTLRCYGN
ncbi:MAG: PQQ-binding-like beta-propeller repeat protein [Phycisphaerae bacterium]|nr:PQQ-binding-like beta-propeller repeat protein [Phycisphaerae bacterium]